MYSKICDEPSLAFISLCTETTEKIAYDDSANSRLATTQTHPVPAPIPDGSIESANTIFREGVTTSNSQNLARGSKAPDVGAPDDPTPSSEVFWITVGGCAIGALIMTAIWFCWRCATRGSRNSLSLSDVEGAEWRERVYGWPPWKRTRGSPETKSAGGSNNKGFRGPAIKSHKYQAMPAPFLSETRERIVDRASQTHGGSRFERKFGLFGWNACVAPSVSLELTTRDEFSRCTLPSAFPSIGTPTFVPLNPRTAAVSPLLSVLKQSSAATPPFKEISGVGSSAMSRSISPVQRTRMQYPQRSCLDTSRGLSRTQGLMDERAGGVVRPKKEVRFGECEIREFGRTPFASTANSVMSRSGSFIGSIYSDQT
ncbi:hypothetical protein MMC19_001457 [Ptychographa xylographoides]|nr:hypothetical protein [Ptychographa xylographoides]